MTAASKHGRSLRGLLEVMPSMDLHFYGVTWGWFGFGVIRAVPRRSKR